MDSAKLLICLFAFATFAVAIDGFTPCAMNGFIHGKWGVYTSQDSENYDFSHNITITSDIMFNYGLKDFPTLMFFCFDYDGSGRFIAFGSPETEIFNQYVVRIYFCWYLTWVNSYTYNIMEGTRETHTDSSQHAKAFLVNGTLDANEASVCELPYHREPSPPYKQIRKVVTLNWGGSK